MSTLKDFAFDLSDVVIKLEADPAPKLAGNLELNGFDIPTSTSIAAEIDADVKALLDGQVTTNKDNITTLNGDTTVTNSVDDKIKTQVLDNIIDDVTTADATKLLSANQGKVLDERVTALKTATALYLGSDATDNKTYALENNTAEPLAVMIEGFVIDDTNYSRDASGIVLNDAADDNEQIYIVAYNG